MAQQNNP